MSFVPLKENPPRTVIVAEGTLDAEDGVRPPRSSTQTTFAKWILSHAEDTLIFDNHDLFSFNKHIIVDLIKYGYVYVTGIAQQVRGEFSGYVILEVDDRNIIDEDIMTLPNVFDRFEKSLLTKYKGDGT
jgi:hypothetical protein